MTNCDVTVLFTRIPQPKLLNIISDEVENRRLLTDENAKVQFMLYMQTIINFNIFRVKDDIYLQTTGLPMGGGLSGTLANIYLGVLEKFIVSNPKILLFNRFMDDILLISTFSTEELDSFINDLRDIYELPLTMTYNHHCVTFLDMMISLSTSYSLLSISPYSRNDPIYPLPSLIQKRGTRKEMNIIKSQILRTWRFSSNDHNFSSKVTTYLQHLMKTPYERSIRRGIFKFLLPVKLSTHFWHTNIVLCKTCQTICSSGNISIIKILPIGSRYISTRQPINCMTPNIYIIIKEMLIFTMELISSIHLHLQKTEDIGIIILPIGGLHNHQIMKLLKENDSIYFSQDIQPEIQINRSCHLYDIYRNPSEIIGMEIKRKPPQTIRQYFNNFSTIFK
jgi:hypothetical protein